MKPVLPFIAALSVLAACGSETATDSEQGGASAPPRVIFYTISDA